MKSFSRLNSFRGQEDRKPYLKPRRTRDPDRPPVSLHFPASRNHTENRQHVPAPGSTCTIARLTLAPQIPRPIYIPADSPPLPQIKSLPLSRARIAPPETRCTACLPRCTPSTASTAPPLAACICFHGSTQKVPPEISESLLSLAFLASHRPPGAPPKIHRPAYLT